MAVFFSANFANIVAAEGGQGLPDGFYKVKITSVEPSTASTGTHQAHFKFEVAEGDFAGTERQDWQVLPKSLEDKALMYWRTILESCGHGAAQIDQAGEIQISDEILVGKIAHIQWAEGDKEANKKPKVTWLTPETWADRKKKMDAAAGAGGGSALGGGKPAGGGLGGGGGTQNGAGTGGGLAAALGAKLGGGGGGGGGKGLGGGLGGGSLK